MPTYQLKVDEANKDLRLDVFLAKNLPQIPSRSFVKRLIDSKGVTVNHKNQSAHYKVSAGEEVQVDAPPIGMDNIEPENISLEIFYEDDDLIVVNKPIGMLVHPATGQYSGTLVNALLHHSKELSNINEPSRPGIVHRMDKETSGLILVAKNDLAHTHLAAQFEEHTIKKRYVALVEGLVEFDEGLIDAPLGRHPRHRDKKAVLFHNSKEAQTLYTVLKRGKDKTLIALFPQTGRTHQLRVHMRHLGHSILGDDKYGKKSSFPRLALHAQSIGLIHPQTAQYIEFSSKVPPEFLKAV